MDCEIAIIGAGVAGLAAAATLKRAGRDVRCLEATSRIGGRIFTVHDPLSPVPIELGAEFVHGLPPQTWELIRAHNLTAYEHTEEAVHLDRGRILKEKKTGEIADRVLAAMSKSFRRDDESFEDYLTHSHQKPQVKNWARVHIEGFNAARKEVISAASLAQEAEAAEKIEGDRVFRILNGYDAIPQALLRSIPDHASVLRLNSVVEKVKWRRGSAEVHYRSGIDRQQARLRCRQLIVTVPLGVLHRIGSVLFQPEPAKVLKAAQSLKFGQVYRLTFRFREAFWQEDKTLKRVGFLVSQDKEFFAWWTTHPVVSPLLTGWTAGTAAIRFRSTSGARIAGEALASLKRILNRPIPRPEAVYFHDWRADPFFGGAYSYVPVNALKAREALAKPVEATLFFAGEASDVHGHGSTYTEQSPPVFVRQHKS